jgi:cytochrome c-type biogenesis protein CcmH/NrfG
MTTAFRDFVSVIQYGGRVLLTTLRIGSAVFLLALIPLGIWRQPETPEQEAARLNRQAGIEQAEKQNEQLKRALCLEAKACDKYSELVQHHALELESKPPF